MNLSPTNNINLFGYKDFFIKLINLHEKKILPNKIILSGNNGIGKSTFVYHLINYFFSKNEDHKYNVKENVISEANNSYILIKKNCHPNLFLIKNVEEKSDSQISKVREMINFVNKSSFNNEFKIVLIDNIELLNTNSVNALLKVIEEPNNKLYFFLIHGNNINILDTLKSRCIEFKMFLQNKDSLKTINYLINNNFYSNLNDDFKNIYNTPGEIIHLYNFFKDNKIDEQISIDEFLKLIINKSLFKKNLYIKSNLNRFIELYFKKKIYYFNSKDNIYYLYKYFLSKINECSKYNLDFESVLIEFKGKIINE